MEEEDKNTTTETETALFIQHLNNETIHVTHQCLSFSQVS